jgi:hypothetical protein
MRIYPQLCGYTSVMPYFERGTSLTDKSNDLKTKDNITN